MKESKYRLTGTDGVVILVKNSIVFNYHFFRNL